MKQENSRGSMGFVYIILMVISVILALIFINFIKFGYHSKSVNIDSKYAIPDKGYRLYQVTNSFLNYKKGQKLHLLEVNSLGGTKCWGVSPDLNQSNIIYIESSNLSKCVLLSNYYRLP